MPITYPLTFPSPGLATIVWRPTAVAAVSTSPYTLKTQVQVHPGQIWQAEVAFPTMLQSTAEEVVTFLLKCNGVEGTFNMGDPALSTPRGTAADTPGTPQVDGASQTGNDLNIKGAPSGASGYLLAGDWIQLGSGSSAELYKVLDDVDTDSVGDATLTLWPELRSSPSDSATVTVSNTVGLFRLAENVMEYSIDEAVHYGIEFNVVEAIS